MLNVAVLMNVPAYKTNTKIDTNVRGVFHVVSVAWMTHTTTFDVVVMAQLHFPARIVYVCNYFSNRYIL